MQVIAQDGGVSAPVRSGSVLELDQDDFDRACGVLMHQVLQDGPPDALIAIPTGGLHVARAMARVVDYPLSILPVTCRRPSTRHKQGAAAMLKAVLATLPHPITDRLRVVEHALLTRRPPARRPGRYQLDADEIISFGNWLQDAGPMPSLVIVDDAVDTGTTLSRILDVVRSQAPRAARIRSAVITVTTLKPGLFPDYTIYHRQLCRFPWSLDA